MQIGKLNPALRLLLAAVVCLLIVSCANTPEVVCRWREPFPSRSFVITFDDGYCSVFQEAFPVLQRYGMTATVFLTVGKPTDEKNHKRITPMNGYTMLGSKEVKAMHRAGLAFGAHTLTHPNLTKIKGDALKSEICDSKFIIEDKLGTSVVCFAYPYGCYNIKIKQVVQKSFDCGCSDNLGLVHRVSDIYALQRVDAYFLRGQKLFDLMLTKSFPFYIQACNMARLTRRAFYNRCHQI